MKLRKLNLKILEQQLERKLKTKNKKGQSFSPRMPIFATANQGGVTNKA